MHMYACVYVAGKIQVSWLGQCILRYMYLTNRSSVFKRSSIGLKSEFSLLKRFSLQG